MFKTDQKRGEDFYFRGLNHNEQGNWGFAEEEFYKALIIFQKIKNWEKAVCCLCSLGNVAFNKGNLSETLKHWLDALTLYEQKLNKKTDAGELCLEIGDLYFDLKVRMSLRVHLVHDSTELTACRTGDIYYRSFRLL